MNEDNRIGLLALAFIVLAVGVCIIVFVLDGCKIEPIWEFDEIPDLGIQTVQDAMGWVAYEIRYVSDDIHYPADEYWQSPAQTYVWRSGDCEDYAILALYLIHRDVGIDGMMWCSTNHGWVYADGHEWEPQLGMICDGWYSVIQMIPYEQVMRRATTTHKAIQEQEAGA